MRLEREQPLTFLEFNYMILQAYDFLELNRRFKCTLQLGGSDQWGNMVCSCVLPSFVSVFPVPRSLCCVLSLCCVGCFCMWTYTRECASGASPHACCMVSATLQNSLLHFSAALRKIFFRCHAAAPLRMALRTALDHVDVRVTSLSRHSYVMRLVRSVLE